MEEKAAKEAAKAQRRAALEAKKAAKQKNTLLNHFAVAKTVGPPAYTPTVLLSTVGLHAPSVQRWCVTNASTA